MGIRLNYDEYIGKRYSRLTIQNVFRRNKNTYATCLCDCGNVKDILLSNIKKGSTKSCGCLEKESRYNREHSSKDVIGKRFGKLIVLEDSNERKSNGAVIWKCQCDCGNITYSDSSNLKRGHTTSCGCAKQDYVDSLKIDIVGKKFGLLTVVNELNRSQYNRRTYLCKCDCGEEIIIDGASLTTGHTLSCGCSRRSNGELLIDDILHKHNIKHIHEHKFEDCINERKLPFDFYLPENNICIEYQGKQHYEVVEFWGGEEGLQQRQHNDAIKKQYCIAKEIRLMEIPYGASSNKVEKMILDVLNP